MVFIMSDICNNTYTQKDEADDAVDARVRAFPHSRQANYSQTMQNTRITKNYPQYGGELFAGNVDGVHDPVVPVDGHCVSDRVVWCMCARRARSQARARPSYAASWRLGR